jgi:hypothetical protein
MLMDRHGSQAASSPPAGFSPEWSTEQQARSAQMKAQLNTQHFLSEIFLMRQPYPASAGLPGPADFRGGPIEKLNSVRLRTIIKYMHMNRGDPSE